MTRSPFITLCACIAAALALKAQRVHDLVTGANDAALWRWLPVTVGGDVLLAVALAVAVALVARRRPRAAVVASSIAVLTVGGFAVANAISYATTESAITLQRLLGEDGAGFGDIALLDPGDAVSGLIVALAVAVGAFVGWQLHKRVPHGFARMACACAAAGSVSFVVQTATAGKFITRLSEQSSVVFARSVVEKFAPKRVHPTFAPSYPKVPQADDWQRISRPVTTPHDAEVAPVRNNVAAKNVVIFMAETMSMKHSSFTPGGEDTTPNLTRRAQSGLLMTRAYSPYCLSIQAIFGVVCSDWPVPSGANIATINPRIDCGEASQAFALHDVKSGLFHAGNFGFSDKLALLGRRKYDIEQDAQSLARTVPRADGKPWDTSRWGIDDRAMVQGVLSWIDGLPKDQRFMALVIPISAHYPYILWNGEKAKFPSGSQKDRYLSSVVYLDKIFEEMMQGLEQRGLANDTAVIVVGDHGEGHGEQAHETPGKRLSYETHAHVPLVILHPGDVPAQSSNRVVALMDIVPTALDLMGLPPDARHRGRSMFSASWQPRRVFLAGKAETREVGIVDNDMKFLIDTQTLEPQLYDLHADPHELNNLAELQADNAAAFAQDAFAWRDWQAAHLKAAPSLGDDVDIHAGVLARAQAQSSDGTTSKAEVLKRERRRVERGSHDCFVVQIPPDGSYTIRGTDDDWVREISSLRIGRIEGETQIPNVRMTVLSDGVARGIGIAGRIVQQKRLEIERPKHTIEIQLKATGPQPLLCVTFSEIAWRGIVKNQPTPAPDDEF